MAVAGWAYVSKRGKGFVLVLWLSAALAVFFSCEASAKPVGGGEAERAVRGWLRAGQQRLGRERGDWIESVETFSDDASQPVYHIVNLQSVGFVIVSGDDEVEPIIGVVSAGSYDASDSNPLGALVSRDVPGRVERVRRGMALSQMASGRAEKSQEKWAKLIAYDSSTVGAEGISVVSEVWVAPLIQSKWSQTTACGNACYNYYTPPYDPCDPANYPCGCVATAMAQLMRYHEYPTAGIGVHPYTITVNGGSSQTAYTLGGNGSGGAYNWSLMVLEPGCSTTDSQRAAIGALCYDAAISVEMDFGSGGSAAYVYLARESLPNRFDYSNAIDGWNNNNNIGPGLVGMLSPGLDAGLPSLLGITGGSGGHAVVTDGYGYDGSTLYHHLNMGWAGDDDAWYNLPNVDSSPSFNSVHEVIYNIYITGTGEIISGRVTDSGTGEPVSGASVTAVRSGGGTYNTTTNSNGIYALVNVPSNSSYTVSVVKTGYLFSSQPASTGLSEHDEPVSGNCWGVDFLGSGEPTPPVAFDTNVVTEPNTAVMVALEASDEGEPNPPGVLSYIIASLPSYGVLSDPCDSEIDSAPYTLVGYGNEVLYTPAPCQAGADTFDFMANDGGTLPDGGDSNEATVTMTVEVHGDEIVIYETGFDSGLPAGWSIIDGGSSSDTWMSENPNPHGWTSPYWTGIFMIVDSDWAGYVSMDEQLITPSLDCTGLTGVTLKFNHKYWYNSGDEVADVDIRIDGGAWQNVISYQAFDDEGQVELPLSSFGADGASDVQIRWHYYNAYYDWYWGIDDVEITASAAAAPGAPVGDFDRDCSVDHQDLGLLASTWLKGLGEPDYKADCDLSGDNFVDAADFAYFAGNWLAEVE